MPNAGGYGGYPINPFMVAGLPHPSFEPLWGPGGGMGDSPLVPPFPGKFERNEDLYEDYVMGHHRLELARRQRAFKNVSDYIAQLSTPPASQNPPPGANRSATFELTLDFIRMSNRESTTNLRKSYQAIIVRSHTQSSTASRGG